LPLIVPVFAPYKERNMNIEITNITRDHHTSLIGMTLPLLTTLFFSVKAIS